MYCQNVVRELKILNTYFCDRVLIRVSIPSFGGEMAVVLPRSGHMLTLKSRLVFRTITLCSLRPSMPIEIILVHIWRASELSSAWTLARASRILTISHSLLFECLLAAIWEYTDPHIANIKVSFSGPSQALILWQVVLPNTWGLRLILVCAKSDLPPDSAHLWFFILNFRGIFDISTWQISFIGNALIFWSEPRFAPK